MSKLTRSRLSSVFAAVVLLLAFAGAVTAECTESCAVPKKSDQCAQCCPNGNCGWCCNGFATQLKKDRCGAYCAAEGLA